MFHARVEKDPGSFVQLVSQYSGTHKQRGEIRAFTTPDFEAFRTRSQSLSDVAAWRDVHLHFANDARNTLAVLVTCEFFNLYGLSRPLKGRLFSADECSAHDSPRVVLLSEELWQRRFFADPDVVGKLAYLDDVPYTIVGIIPHGFSGRLRGPGIWLPWTSSAQSQQKLTSSNKAASAWLNVEGRLKPGISAASARAELGLIARDQDRLYPGRTTTVSLTNGSFAQDPAIKGTATLVVLLVMGSLLLVVLIACANVTTLLLSRAASRRSELAVRLSLGASRGRLIGMLTAEGMPLAVLAGGLGMLLASGTPSLFRMIMPADAPHYPMQMGSTEFMYLIGVTLLAGCVISWAPAVESLRGDLASMLRESGQGSVRRSRTQSALIVGQVALSLGLAVAAGCFLRFQYDVTVSDPGVDTRQVLIVPLTLRAPRYDATSAASFSREVERRIRELPGVQTVAFGAIPFEGSRSEQVFPNGESDGSAADVVVDRVSSDYFDALELRMVRGRSFQTADVVGDAAVADVVVSKAFVDTYWKGQDPLDRTIRTSTHEVLRVIGVARDTKAQQYGVVDGPRIYRLRRRDASGGPLLVRFVGDSQQVADSIRALVAGMDPQQRVIPRTLRSDMEDMANRLWLMTGLVSFLASVAIFLAMTGLYAIVAFSVQQRTRELGLRVALGATDARILYSVMSWGAKPFVTGAVIGLGIAISGLFALRALLAGIPEAGAIRVRPLDPVVCTLAVNAVALVAAAAILGPARRALRLQPAECLRLE